MEKGDGMRRLSEDIREILVKTTYQAAFGCGNTAEEISTWEKRAILAYQNHTKFHLVVDKQTALIMSTVKDYLTRKGEQI